MTPSFCFRCSIAIAIPSVHDLRSEELSRREAVRTRLVHRQSTGPSSSGSRAQNYERVLATTLSGTLPRRKGLPMSVSEKTFFYSTIGSTDLSLPFSVDLFFTTRDIKEEELFEEIDLLENRTCT